MRAGAAAPARTRAVVRRLAEPRSPRSRSRARSRCSPSASAGGAPTSPRRCSAPSSCGATGSSIWNSQWFGGHALLSYSVLAPVLGALTGPIALGAISGVAAAVLFERILRFAYGRTAWVGALWFALGHASRTSSSDASRSRSASRSVSRPIYALQRRHPRARGRRRAAVLAVEPARRRVPPARRDRVGVRAARAPRRSRSRSRPARSCRIAAIARAVPEPRPRAVRAVGARSGTSRCARRGRARGAPHTRAALRRGVLRGRGRRVVRRPDRARRQRQPARPVRRRPVARVRAAPAPPAAARRPRHPAPHLAVVSRGRRHRVRADRPVDARRVLHAGRRTTSARRTGPIGRVEIPSTYRHWEAAYAAPALLLARAGSASSTSRTTRSSTRSRSPRRATTTG